MRKGLRGLYLSLLVAVLILTASASERAGSLWIRLNVGELLETEENVLFRQTLEMLASMEKGDMFFKKIELSNLQIRAFVYDSLICQGTPEHLMESMETGQLQAVIQELYNQDIERGTIQVSGDNYISFTPKID